jgi:hypothetical protein
MLIKKMTSAMPIMAAGEVKVQWLSAGLTWLSSLNSSLASDFPKQIQASFSIQQLTIYSHISGKINEPNSQKSNVTTVYYKWKNVLMPECSIGHSTSLF